MAYRTTNGKHIEEGPTSEPLIQNDNDDMVFKSLNFLEEKNLSRKDDM